MKHINSVVKVGALTIKRSTLITAAAALSMAGLAPLIASMQAGAAPITNRSLMVTSTVANDDELAPDGSTYTFGTSPGQVGAGDPRNGKKVGHTYTFTVPTVGNIEGFTIEYCESAFGWVGAGACAAAHLENGGNGFSAAAWTGATVSVNGTDFNVTATWNTITLVMDSAPLNIAAPNTVVTIDFPATDTNYFVNPDSTYMTDAPLGTYFAHIKTYALAANATGGIASDGTGEVDNGTVTNNVTNAVRLYTRVQETLNFSVESSPGDSVPSTSVTPGDTCTPLTGASVLNLGDSNNALSTQQAYDAYSFFRLATNSTNGTVVYYSGDTLKSGSVDIDQIGTAATNSEVGVEQFGLAFDNTATNHTLSALAPLADYASGNGTISDLTPANNASFAFDVTSVATPEPVAQSTGTVNCETGAVRYVANIAEDTPAGIYQTKINYIASPTY